MKKSELTEEGIKILKEEAEGIAVMARIGRHMVTFVCECVARGIDPKMALEGFEKASDDSVDVPMSILWKWISLPGPKNLHNLSEALGVDLNKTAEKMKRKLIEKDKDHA